MPLKNLKKWILISSFAFFTVIIAGVIGVVVYYIVVPNSPSRSEPQFLPSFILGVVSVIALVSLWLFITLVAWKSVRRSEWDEYPVTTTTPFRESSQVTYRTESNASRKGRGKRGGVFEPQDNFGFAHDEASPGNQSREKPKRKEGVRSSFTEALNNSFERIRESYKKEESVKEGDAKTTSLGSVPEEEEAPQRGGKTDIGEIVDISLTDDDDGEDEEVEVEIDVLEESVGGLKRRSILDSVDEEGYHFDTLPLEKKGKGARDVTAPEDADADAQSESDIDTRARRNFLKRLDTFDKSILGVNDPESVSERSEAVVGGNEGATFDTEREGGNPERSCDYREATSQTQDTLEGLGRLKPFDKYLSLVRLDSENDIDVSSPPTKTQTTADDRPPVLK